jgi:hypothetical protein
LKNQPQDALKAMFLDKVISFDDLKRVYSRTDVVQHSLALVIKDNLSENNILTLFYQ